MLFLVRVIAAIVWAVVGLLLWIPMIVRAFAVQTGALLLSAVTDTDTAGYDAWFTRVLQFYPNGFVRIFSNESLSTATEDNDIKFSRAFFEILFATVFYFATAFAYYSVLAPESSMRLGILDGFASAFSGADPIVLEYSNATTTQDYVHSGLFTGSRSARARFRVLSVSAPSETSNRVQLNYRICNVGEINTSMRLYAYFTDSRNQTFRWEEQDTGTVEPGACHAGSLSSDSSHAWSQMNFRQGQYTFRFGNVTASIRVAE